MTFNELYLPPMCWYGDEEEMVKSAVRNISAIVLGMLENQRTSGDGDMWRDILQTDHVESAHKHLHEHFSGDLTTNHLHCAISHIAKQTIKEEWMRGMGEITVADLVDGDEFSPNQWAVRK